MGTVQEGIETNQMTTGEKGMMLGYSGSGPQNENLHGPGSSAKKVNSAPRDEEDVDDLVDDDGVYEEKD